ncbi:MULTISPECIES: alpha/beta hydrolase [Acidobacterium]|uniref:Esterase n=1 Tax=Acidobacterium capsulatum (strain ATCC 51196 / DSM 11244 / BCRC 80197 / JCM 7670 / NBRC 15755 / NCIMB 13165 / 161) TaxID=240015 RepID=C1F891_ACIC5|nr:MULTISPECIES: alpha/beta hydrolase [Acidobacterium]ACO33622.1 esterase [Acidobacterium capsulatum ATCC 51196]HCT59775.1 alpha/beta hydrolase [Acidobacterium sp.]
MNRFCSLLLLATFAASAALAQQATTAATAPRKDSSYIGPNGTAYVTRVVPVPTDISPQAQAFLARHETDAKSHQSIAQQRAGTDTWQEGAGKVSLKLYPAKLSRSTIAGVPVRIITPLTIPPSHRDYVLMNVHGGGFIVDSGSLTETIPMANLTQTKVVSVLYPLSPEHPFPAAVNASVAVYKQLLKTYPAKHIIIYGTSAGAILTGEIAVDLKKLGLPEPCALGIFSGFGDFSKPGDSQSLFALDGLSGYLAPPNPGKLMLPEYEGKTNPRDPVLSPVYANLSGLPPTLFLTSTRDLLLSGTTILDRKFFDAGDKTQLIVFEALPHAFWNNPRMPEAKQADHDMANFFSEHLYATQH